MPVLHFDRRTVYHFTYYEPGDVGAFDVADARNLELGRFGHAVEACPGAPACPNGPLQEAPRADPIPARPNDAGNRLPDGNPLVCATCKKTFATEAALKTHGVQKKHRTGEEPAPGL